MTIRTIAGGAALASLIAVGALAHSGAKGVVKDRMMGMGVMGEAVKTLAPMMQGQTPYDAAAVRTAAGQISAHAGDTLTGLFPEGSTEKPSEAKASIWKNWDRFVALAAELNMYSQGLALASANGLDAAGGMPGADMMGGASMMSGETMMGSAGMMGDDAMMGAATAQLGPEFLAEMPADAVFNLVSQTCAACHTQFRAESR